MSWQWLASSRNLPRFSRTDSALPYLQQSVSSCTIDRQHTSLECTHARTHPPTHTHTHLLSVPVRQLTFNRNAAPPAAFLHSIRHNWTFYHTLLPAFSALSISVLSCLIGRPVTAASASSSSSSSWRLCQPRSLLQPCSAARLPTSPT
jgi:hypothetical protein